MWIRAVIILFFLFFASGVSSAQDICTACSNQGCLVSYDKAKSDKCRSCQICLAEPPHDADEKHDDEASDRSEPKYNFKDNTVIVIASPTEKNGQKVKNCAENEWQDDASCQDLRLQERMAKAAERVIRLTGVQIFFTLLSLMGLGATVLVTLGALREAKRANEIAAETSRTQLQSYVYVEDIRAVGKIIQHATNDQLYVEYFFDIRNSGVVPARDIVFDFIFANSPVPDLSEANRIAETLVGRINSGEYHRRTEIGGLVGNKPLPIDFGNGAAPCPDQLRTVFVCKMTYRDGFMSPDEPDRVNIFAAYIMWIRDKEDESGGRIHKEILQSYIVTE